MPRITAPTVPEHRAQMEAAILDAAEQALSAGAGVNALTMGRVAERVGIQRTSLYKYFASLDALIEAVVARDFPRWTQAVQAAMDAEQSPHAKVVAYARSNLLEVLTGDHAWRAGLGRVAMSERGRQRIAALHADLAALPREPLVELGAEPVDLHLAAVQALVNMGTVELGRGTDPETVIAFVTGSITRLLEIPPRPGVRA